MAKRISPHDATTLDPASANTGMRSRISAIVDKTGLPSYPEATTLRRFLVRVGPSALGKLRALHNRLLNRMMLLPGPPSGVIAAEIDRCKLRSLGAAKPCHDLSRENRDRDRTRNQSTRHRRGLCLLCGGPEDLLREPGDRCSQGE